MTASLIMLDEARQHEAQQRIPSYADMGKGNNETPAANWAAAAPQIDPGGGVWRQARQGSHAHSSQLGDYSDQTRQALSGWMQGGAAAAHQQNLDRSIMAQQALASSARGMNPAAAARMASFAGGRLMGEGSSEAAKLRALDQQNYMQALSAARAQEAYLVEMYLKMGLSIEQANAAAKMEMFRIQQGVEQGERDRALQQEMFDYQKSWESVGKQAVAGAAGGVAAGLTESLVSPGSSV